MTYCGFLRVIARLLFAVTVGACVLSATAAHAITADTEASRPNIVFILIDDMGWPDAACYGHAFHETPAIDRLCSQGMKFTNFYAATPVCSSTRATIQSGQYAARVGITKHISRRRRPSQKFTNHWRPFEKLIEPSIEDALPPDIRTPGDVLGTTGYATGYFGKWHLGYGAEHEPDKRGYDVTGLTLPKAFRAWRETQGSGPKKMDVLTDQAIWFIEQNRDRPFFVTLAHHAVHIPLEATPEAIEKYRQKPKPADGVNNPVYAAMTEDLDRSVGRILDRLDALGLSDKTMVVFTSDNGGLRKIYTGIGEVVSTNAPLRDEKGTLYEGGIRVPMIVRWPGVVEPGTACDEPTTTADLMSTFCEAAGAKLPNQPIDGLSLVPVLTDRKAKLAREAIYFHYPHYHHSRPAGAIRAGNMKLIEFFDGTPPELYNLGNDISETTNLAASEPRQVARLQAMLAEWRVLVGARMPLPNPDYDPDRAGQWWNPNTNKPIDLKAQARRYRSRAVKRATADGRKSPQAGK